VKPTVVVFFRTGSKLSVLYARVDNGSTFGSGRATA
jgi:hypothetical protein